MQISSKKSNKSIKVMLIDDHPVVRDGYARLLENTPDIRVVGEADDGETGCELYAMTHPDVVILDLSMPGMGGLEALRRIMAKDPAARVLIFTMHDSETLILRAMESGAVGYLTKHSGIGQMIEAVRQVAQGNMFIDPKYIPDIMRQRLKPSSDPLQSLSAREFQLFQLLAEGHSVIEIAEILSISPKTVGVHHTNIMKKLSIQNTAQLTRLAIRHGVIQA
ncbi:MAG: response regulator transcription factor [Sulfuricella sp.]|nr:response regulator transcription factor [Sulfuricella sp.]